MGHALPHHDCKVSVIILKLKNTGSIFHSHNLTPLIFYCPQKYRASVKYLSVSC